MPCHNVSQGSEHAVLSEWYLPHPADVNCLLVSAAHPSVTLTLEWEKLLLLSQLQGLDTFSLWISWFGHPPLGSILCLGNRVGVTLPDCSITLISPG